MTAYPEIRNYNQLLAENDLGSQNMNFFDSQGQAIPNSPALRTLTYYDQDYSSVFPTYGADTNYYERNRRLNGAYGNAWYGDCNWLNPLNHSVITENHFYYLEDFTNGGRYSNLFIEGLTLFTRDRPAIYPTWYNSTFRNDSLSYYRIDILGSEYPYSHGGVKADIIIQQFGSGLNAFASDKLYLSYAQSTMNGAYHSEYRIRIPIGAMLFNDKLYVPSAPIITPGDPVEDPLPPYPPVDEPPIDQPPVNEPLPTDPYSNFGGDTTDTGPTENIDQSVNPWFDRSNPRYVDEYIPTVGWWRKIFRWY